MKPLEGLLVLDFSIFLAGPLAALRLGDLGARVIKIERPDVGDLCRQLYISNLELDGDSTLFHSINRNKESFTANFKDPADLARVRKLIARADVLIANFRPGVLKKLHLDYPAVRQINPRLVYGSITGYGDVGPWAEKPGQDLLAQALSGITWLSGDGGADAGPVPMGLAVADMFAGHFLAQGILACLIRRARTGEGGLVETSLLESLLDFQFEVLTTHLNDGGRLPERSSVGNGHAYLGAPYGIYRTADGWLAIAMNPLEKLADLLDLPALRGVSRAETFSRRDELKRLIAQRLQQKSTNQWLAVLEPADLWCAPVLDWPSLLRQEAFKVLEMTLPIRSARGQQMISLQCPLRIDGRRPTSDRGAPSLGADTERIAQEFGL
ncbi:MAG: CaiB/BaiF CoA-transferase family protein [Phycisphaerales bacterium]|nr:CaiB/BaiF CoA-transferase family protein [Phycisphaerales bacterium]